MRIGLILMLSLLVVSSGRAIVVRHDRADADFLTSSAEFPMVARVGAAMGTLIAPRWVLTAAHVADGVSTGVGDVRFGDHAVAVADVYVHPDYARGEDHRDLALIELVEPIDGIVPVSVHREPDELGRRMTLVGTGIAGTGLTGPAGEGGTWRRARNVVDGVQPGWLSLRFDAPPDGDDLEGISGPGDSGGPALVRVGEAWHVAGVSAYNDGGELCRYGTVDHYSRVADEVDWIEAVMRGDVAPGRAPGVLRYGKTADGQTTVTREEITSTSVSSREDVETWDVVAALSASLQDEDTGAYEALFADAYLARRRSTGDPLAAVHAFMRDVIGVHGAITGFHALSGEAFEIPESAHPLRAVTFHLADGTSGYVGLAIDDDGKIDHLSLFVQPGICRKPHPCPLSRSLDERRPGGR